MLELGSGEWLTGIITLTILCVWIPLDKFRELRTCKWRADPGFPADVVDDFLHVWLQRRNDLYPRRTLQATSARTQTLPKF